MWDALRFAVRTVFSRKLRSITVASVATVALVAAAAGVVLSFADAILVRPLPFANADRLLSVQLVKVADRGKSLFGSNTPLPVFEAWRRDAATLGDFAASALDYATVTGTSRPHRALALAVSDRLFDVLGVPPSLGPGFGVKLDVRDNIVVLSDRYWAKWFGRSPSIVGQSITLDDVRFRIAGVMPPGFRVPFSIPETSKDEGEIWIPLHAPNRELPSGVDVMLLRKPSVSPRQVESHLDRLMVDVRTPGEGIDQEVARMVSQIVPMKTLMAGQVRGFILILLGAVVSLLLLACVNVAALLSAAMNSRSDEFALRTALGAPRRRIVSQVVLETCVISALGGAVGLFLAWAAVPVVVAEAGNRLPDVGGIGVDWRVATAMIVLICSVGLLTSTLPVMRATDVLPQSSLAGVRSVGRQRGRAILADLLVSTEIALAILLLCAMGVFVVSFRNLADPRGGYNPRNVIIATVSLAGRAYADAPSQSAAEQRITHMIRGVAGVSVVAVGDGAPSLGGFRTTLRIPEAAAAATSSFVWRTSADYFDALGMRIVRGRPAENETEAMIDEAGAAAVFADQSPLGRTLHVGKERAVVRITGVVSNIADVGGGVEGSGRKRSVVPHLYTRYAQWSGRHLPLVIRAQHLSPEVINAIKRSIAVSDPQLLEVEPRSLEAAIAMRFGRERFLGILASAMGAIAFFIAIGGLYALILKGSSDRVREFGVRLALGASSTSVLWTVISRGVALAVAGIGGGLIAVLALAEPIRPFLFETQLADPQILGAVGAAVLVVAILASLAPAVHAMRADPAGVLRDE